MLMLRSSYYLQQLRDILYIAPVVLIAIMGTNLPTAGSLTGWVIRLPEWTAD